MARTEEQPTVLKVLARTIETRDRRPGPEPLAPSLLEDTVRAPGTFHRRPDDLAEADRRIIFARYRGILEAGASRKYDAIKTTKQGPVVVETHDIADYHGKFGEYRRPTRP